MLVNATLSLEATKEIAAQSTLEPAAELESNGTVGGNGTKETATQLEASAKSIWRQQDGGDKGNNSRVGVAAATAAQQRCKQRQQIERTFVAAGVFPCRGQCHVSGLFKGYATEAAPEGAAEAEIDIAPTEF